MNISQSQEYFKNLSLNSEQQKVAEKVMKNIMERLEFLE
jgi:excinuclease UvrABC ATPase subunit